MADRIRRHRAERGPGWTTIEEPLALSAALSDAPGTPALVDCLTLWVSNLLHAGRDIPTETENLGRALAGRNGPTVLVSNEVGLGIVPDQCAGPRPSAMRLAA